MEHLSFMLRGHRNMLGSFEKDGYLYCFIGLFLGYRIYYMLIQQSDCQTTWGHIPEDHNLSTSCSNTKAEKISVIVEN
jgi:hypothetical protein